MGRCPTTKGRRGRGRLDWDDSTSSEPYVAVMQSLSQVEQYGMIVKNLEIETCDYMVSLAPM